MHDGALLVNAGRGAVVDTDALVDAVRAGRIRAALDVTDPEPLPTTTRCGRSTASSHAARRGRHAEAERAAQALARAQMLRYRAGLPLEHVVRPGARPLTRWRWRRMSAYAAGAEREQAGERDRQAGRPDRVGAVDDRRGVLDHDRADRRRRAR